MRHGLRILAAAMLVPVCLAAQDVTGGVVGRVVGPGTTPVPDVLVTASGTSLQGTRTTQSDQTGEFRFYSLPVGIYTVRLAHIGYQAVRVEGVRVQVGRTEGLGDIEMTMQAVELEELVVTARSATLDPTTTAVGVYLTDSLLQNLPTGRDYQSALILLPHANESFYGDAANVAGNTGLENQYYVDGVNVTNPLDGASAVRLPYNFISSIEVLEGGYEASYGRALGGLVNTVTPVGGNDLGFNVFGFFNHSTLTADQKSVTTLQLNTGAAYSYDVGARVSGPVVRDRLWFSAAYNPLVDQVQKAIPTFGWYTDRSTEQRFAGKLTWRVTPATDVELAAFGDPTSHEEVAPPLGTQHAGYTFGNADPFLTTSTSGSVSAILRARHAVGRWSALEGSLARSHWSSELKGTTDRGNTDIPYVDDVTRYVEGGVPYRAKDERGRVTAALRFTSRFRSHAATVGVEFEDSWLNSIASSTPGIERTDTTVWVETVGSSGAGIGIVHNRAPAAFVDVTWRPSSRIAINTGLRWGAQYLTGAADTVVQAFPNQWQPRLGIVVQPGTPGTQKVFASYGRQYLQFPLALSALFWLPYTWGFNYYHSDPRLGGAPDSVKDLSGSESDTPGHKDLGSDCADEVTLGYERLVGRDVRVDVRGMLRSLRSSFGWAYQDPGQPAFRIGTPGQDALWFLPDPKRTYQALELSIERAGTHQLQFHASYVLSRSFGNYSGQFSSDQGGFFAGPLSLMIPEQVQNSTGLLPNDRTHAIKAYGSYRFNFGLTAGTFFSVLSGSPLNEFAASRNGFLLNWVFLVPRGTAGRTPTVYDLNFRMVYDARLGGRASGRVIMDVLHVGNPQRVVWKEQQHYSCRDLVPSCLNPNYGLPLAHQAPMQARLGMELSY